MAQWLRNTVWLGVSVVAGALLLAPTGMQTVSVYVWRQFEQGSVGEGMAMRLIAIGVTACLVLLAHRLAALRRRP